MMDQYFLLLVLLAILVGLYMYQDKIFPKKTETSEKLRKKHKKRTHIDHHTVDSEEKIESDISNESNNSNLSINSDLSMNSNMSAASNFSDGSITFGELTYKSMDSQISADGMSQLSENLDDRSYDSSFG